VAPSFAPSPCPTLPPELSTTSQCTTICFDGIISNYVKLSEDIDTSSVDLKGIKRNTYADVSAVSSSSCGPTLPQIISKQTCTTICFHGISTASVLLLPKNVFETSSMNSLHILDVHDPSFFKSDNAHTLMEYSIPLIESNELTHEQAYKSTVVESESSSTMDVDQESHLTIISHVSRTTEDSIPTCFASALQLIQILYFALKHFLYSHPPYLAFVAAHSVIKAMCFVLIIIIYEATYGADAFSILHSIHLLQEYLISVIVLF